MDYSADPWEHLNKQPRSDTEARKRRIVLLRGDLSENKAPTRYRLECLTVATMSGDA